MMEARVRMQCSTNDDARLMFYRVRESEERWPDPSWDEIRGRQLCNAWNRAGNAFDQIRFEFPRTGLVRGDDYPNVLHFIKERSGLHPGTRLVWDNDRVEITGYAVAI